MLGPVVLPTAARRVAGAPNAVPEVLSSGARRPPPTPEADG
jgi:hypothetical protein